MPEYRIYSLTSDRRIAGPATEIECDSDEEAIQAAETLKDGFDIEVWQAGRRVIRIESKPQVR